MGLDMYIHKKNKRNKKEIHQYFEDIDYSKWQQDEVAYWRKANQIHRWFVENVQDGVDNCDYYKVSKEQLEELLDLCKEILDNVELIDGKVYNGYKVENGIKMPIYEEGKVITNKQMCEDLLPTQEGFFFGSTEYDQYYIDDIKNTVEQIEKIFDEVDFNKYELYYHSSW